MVGLFPAFRKRQSAKVTDFLADSQMKAITIALKRHDLTLCFYEVASCIYRVASTSHTSLLT